MQYIYIYINMHIYIYVYIVAILYYDPTIGSGGRREGSYVPHLYVSFSLVTLFEHVPSNVMNLLFKMILQYIVAIQYHNILLQSIIGTYMMVINNVDK